MKKILLPLLLLPFFSYCAQQNFNHAKTQLVKIYKDNPQQRTFYCDCEFSWQGKKGIVDFSACGYQVRKNKNRAERIEWEHVMPAYAFGHQLQCWQQGGRKNCAKVKKFNLMEGDMHNLQPAIGEVNGDRSNFGYGQFTKTFDQYGACQVATDFKNKQFQPMDKSRGIIARTYFYMADRYNIRLSKQEQRLMAAWDKMYPPSEWECKRNQIIAKRQGNDNKFITQKCKSF